MIVEQWTAEVSEVAGAVRCNLEVQFPNDDVW